MKILTDIETSELVLPALQIDYKLFLLDGNKITTFDTFDRVNPDVMIIKSSSITKSVIKNILERPHLKIAIVGDNNSKEVNELKNEIGDSFLELNDTYFCNIVGYQYAQFINFLASDVVCLEGADVNNLNSFIFPQSVNYKIFSSKKFIHHNNFCGTLVENYKPSALKSSRYCIVNKKDELNAIYAGSIPILDSLFTPANETSIDEIKNSKTNFHALADIFKKWDMEKEANLVLNQLRRYL